MLHNILFYLWSERKNTSEEIENFLSRTAVSTNKSYLLLLGRFS